MMKRKPLYAALDLHSKHSVLGSMDYDGNNQARVHFVTEAEGLAKQVKALAERHRGPVYLTLEAGAMTRWASGIVRPLVARLIICEPRHNRLIIWSGAVVAMLHNVRHGAAGPKVQ